MSLSQALFVILVIISLSLVDQVVSQLNQQCLNCICQASTGCDLNKKCHNSGPSSYFCGPYQISWSYWSDGGRPGNQGGPHDFETCLNDKLCAEQAIQGYMAKWARDCNGDGLIDCADYAAIHKAGPSSCNAQWLLDSDYWRVFQSSSCASGTDGGFNSEPVNNQPQPQPPTTHWTFPSSRNQTFQPSIVSNEPRFRPFGGQPERVRYNNNYRIPSGNNNPPRHEVFGPAGGQPPTSSGGSITVDVTNTAFDSGSGGESGILRTYPASQPSPPLNNAPETGSYPAPSALGQPSSPPVAPSASFNDESNTEYSGNRPVDSNCLDCLCQASTGCDLNKQCFGNVCGPYLISWPFWSDAGRPGTDYVTCALRKNCAEAAIQGYMSRYGRDCNNDGVINCDDYVIIHQYGPNCGPGVFGTGKFWQDFKTCNQPPIDARSNRVRENVARFRPIERPGQPANLRRDEAITWNGANNRFNENEISGIRPVDRDLNQPERVNSFHNVDEHSSFNPFPFNQPTNSQPPPPPNFNRPNNSNVYFDDVRFPNQPFGPSGPSFGAPDQPRTNDNVPPQPPRNNFRPDQPTPIPPHAHVGPSSPNRFGPEPIINEFRPLPNRDNNNNNINNNQPRESRPIRPDEPNRSVFNGNNDNNGNNNGFQPGILSNDGFRPILEDNNRNNPISPPNNYPNQPIAPPNNNFDRSSPRQPTTERFTPRYDRPNGFNFPSQPFRPFTGNSDYNDPFSRNPVTQPPQPTNPPRSEFNPVTASPPTPPPTTISYSDSDDSSILPVPGIRESRLLPSTPKVNGSMSSECLECICEATSKCDANYPCKNYGGTQACGPYQISISYWLQSGKPGYNGGSSDFINCVTNMNCAQDTLKGYIKTMGKDCNNDGVIDCVDYALIHKLGPNSCQDQNFLDSPYWNDFQACYGFER